MPRPRSRLGLRMALASERDPVIAGGAGFTEGVVRERHGDDGVGGMAGAEDIVDAAKPMLAVEGFHAWSRDLVALDGREVVDEEIAAALPHHVDIEDGAVTYSPTTRPPPVWSCAATPG